MIYLRGVTFFLILEFVIFQKTYAVCELKWVKTDHNKIPPDSVLANTNNPIGDIYPSRAVYEEVLTPGRFNAREGSCFITKDGKEYVLHENFEVLTNPNKCGLQWKYAMQGTVPKNAVEGGKDRQGGPAYVARHSDGVGYMVGGMRKSTGRIYWGWGGAENNSPVYEILTIVEVKDFKEIDPDCKNHKSFGFNNFVCVCTEAQPCDKIPQLQKTAKGVVTSWSSNYHGARFRRQTLKLEPLTTPVNIAADDGLIHITLHRDKVGQKIIGFGGAFTDSTGYNVLKMSPKVQDQILNDYFSKDGLEYNLARVPIGGTDFSLRGYSLDDTPNDKKLEHFGLQKEDHEYKIPLMKKANALATHEIRYYGSPWSAPAWMKTNNKLNEGGSLKGKPGEEYYKIYAKYFVKYLDAYKKEGINHWGITIQNEPWAGQSWPSMGFSAEAERDFLKMDLGPELEKNGYGPDKFIIMSFDHNVGIAHYYFDPIYGDPWASKYCQGMALHWYGHDPKEMLDSWYKKYPNKFLLGTEACVEGGVKLGDWKVADMYMSDIIDDLIHHWSGWTDWNMVLDTKGGPNYAKNFVDAPMIVDAQKGEYYRQTSFYAMGHFSKFLTPGSVRLVHTFNNNVTNHAMVTAFRRPDNATVLIAYNPEDIDIQFVIEDPHNGKLITKLVERGIQSFIYWD